MDSKIEKILRNLTVVFVLILLVIGGASMGIGEIKSILQEKGVIKSVTKGQTVQIDWKKEYPFQIEETQEQTNVTMSKEEEAEEQPEKNVWKRLRNAYLNKVDGIELRVTESKEYVFEKTKLLELSGFVNRIVGKTDFSDTGSGVVLLKNGYLSNAQDFITDDETIAAMAGGVIDFKEWLQNEGIPFLYVQTPTKNSISGSEMPDGVEDYTNLNLDNLLEKLQNGNVSCFDYRKEIVDQGLDWYGLFYKTDHHWTVESGIWAADVLADYLNKNYGLNMDTEYMNSDLYDRRVYEDFFLGFYGRKVTLGYTDPEDFVIPIPKFETDLEVINPDKGMDERGSFGEVMYNHELFEKVDYYNNSCYEAMLYGNRPLTQIINYDNRNGKRVLIIRDSFSLAVAPYLALTTSQIDLVDMRDGFFDGSIRTYIDETKPDIVILMTNAVCERLK